MPAGLAIIFEKIKKRKTVIARALTREDLA